MANYSEISVRDVTNTGDVGLGLGEVDGNLRVCISLGGAEINKHLADEWRGINYSSLTPECAKHLYELLGSVKHVWGGACGK